MTYEAIDAAILRGIINGARTNQQVFMAARGDLHDAAFVSGGDTYRVLDRRLQALRRAGKIIYQRPGGWTLVKTTAEGAQ